MYPPGPPAVGRGARANTTVRYCIQSGPPPPRLRRGRLVLSFLEEFMRKSVLVLVAIALISPVALRGQAARRAITLDDHSRIAAVGDPQRSPDGQWVAY